VNVQVPTGALSGGIVVTTSAGTSGGTSFTVTGTFGCP
jgi:hypothetical protein